MTDDFPIVGCRLDPAGRSEQHDRYRRLGREVEDIARKDLSCTVRFGPGLDQALLRKTMAVESECCPFMSVDYSPTNRLLTLGVSRAALANALDAVVFALSS
jgi:hypothetical protein